MATQKQRETARKNVKAQLIRAVGQKRRSS